MGNVIIIALGVFAGFSFLLVFACCMVSGDCERIEESERADIPLPPVETDQTIPQSEPSEFSTTFSTTPLTASTSRMAQYFD